MEFNRGTDCVAQYLPVPTNMTAFNYIPWMEVAPGLFWSILPATLRCLPNLIRARISGVTKAERYHSLLKCGQGSRSVLCDAQLLDKHWAGPQFPLGVSAQWSLSISG